MIYNSIALLLRLDLCLRLLGRLSSFPTRMETWSLIQPAVEASEIWSSLRVAPTRTT